MRRAEYSRSLAGMTLVELMVALALGSILVGVVTFVWLQSNRVFTTTINRLETYQRLRSVLDVMERDLANTNRTVDMEFYVDMPGPDPDGPGGPLRGRPNGHYDAGDEIQQVGGELFRTPRNVDLDPIYGQSEFGNPGDGFDDFPLSTRQAANGEEAFLYAGAVLSPEPYSIGAGYTDNRFYWRDEVYVRTYAMADGLNKPALVHYRLVQLSDGRSALRRRLWFLNETNQIAYGDPDQPDTDRTALLTTGVADLKIAFYFKETTTQGVGSWYHVGNKDEDWGEDAKALRDADEDRGMVSARGVNALSLEHQDQFGGMNAVSFVFEGVARFEDMQAGGAVLRGMNDAGTALDDTADFPGVRPGDRFYVFNATDDDAVQSAGATLEAKENFPDQILTVEQIFSDTSERWAAVRFVEPINFFRLGTAWLGTRESPSGEVLTEVTDISEGPPRTIVQSFNVQYRVGFLPAAFLVRLSCDDPYNRSILQMERVIRLLEQ